MTQQTNKNALSFDYNVAIVGGGITGACIVRTLLLQSKELKVIINLKVDLFDQGQRGVGGRASHRQRGVGTKDDENKMMRWDHGCQFFRADTAKFKKLVDEWIAKDIAKVWEGTFVSLCNDIKNSANNTSGGSLVEVVNPNNNVDNNQKGTADFFGMPHMPPFYIGSDGMNSIPKGVLDDVQKLTNDKNSNLKSEFNLFTGTRVTELQRDEATQKWKLFGTSGTVAYHDTAEKIVKEDEKKKIKAGKTPYDLLGEGYDAVFLTDVSSSFGKWHRASAGVPEKFASRVRKQVSARVPLFTAMIAFDKATGIEFDTITFGTSSTSVACNDEKSENKNGIMPLWFASKNNSKMLINNDGDNDDDNASVKIAKTPRECWTLVSTPEYAMEKIEETPMQDPITGEFIPQPKDYLVSVPGEDLSKAFCEQFQLNVSTASSDDDGTIDANDNKNSTVSVVHVNAQRWGSALPCHRHLKNDENSKTRKVISGVSYDSGRAPLAPTKIEEKESSTTFLFDKDLMLFQAGDMMSSYTPGFEGAAISGIDAAEHLLKNFIVQ